MAMSNKIFERNGDFHFIKDGKSVKTSRPWPTTEGRTLEVDARKTTCNGLIGPRLPCRLDGSGRLEMGNGRDVLEADRGDNENLVCCDRTTECLSLSPKQTTDLFCFCLGHCRNREKAVPCLAVWPEKTFHFSSFIR